tara:strand:+ start:288 stop:557 length:270 start_codon:yes stop_codon:yes gene_type:complete
MARTLLVGAEIACPTTVGAATSFGGAQVVRLVNTDSSAHKVTVLEEQSGAGIGSMTMPAGTVEYLEKKSTDVVLAASGNVLGTKVGYTA